MTVSRWRGQAPEGGSPRTRLVACRYVQCSGSLGAIPSQASKVSSALVRPSPAPMALRTGPQRLTCFRMRHSRLNSGLGYRRSRRGCRFVTLLYGCRFGFSAVTASPRRAMMRSSIIDADGLEHANKLQQKRVAKECAAWIEREIDIKTIKQSNLLHGKMYYVAPAGVEKAILGAQISRCAALARATATITSS